MAVLGAVVFVAAGCGRPASTSAAEGEVSRPALTLTMHVSGKVFAHREPILSGLRLQNHSDSIWQFRRPSVILEQRLPDGAWTDPLPPIRMDGLGFLPQVAAHETLWFPEYPLHYADLEPGAYRIRSVHLELEHRVNHVTQRRAVAISSAVPFDVVPHTGNASVADEVYARCDRLASAWKVSPSVAEELAEMVDVEGAVSAGLRGWALIRIADYYFRRRDYDGCRRHASKVDFGLMPLPWGGLGSIAEFMAMRAQWVPAPTLAEWDRAFARFAGFQRRFPAFLEVHGYAIYSARRMFLK